MQITRDNYTQYASMVQQMLGNKKERLQQSIKELARKEFVNGKRDDAAYRKLCMLHGETVSPDRKAIYESSMRKTGGKMNAACMFWNSNENKTLSYNPESRNWKAISIEEEFARARLFTSIYNDDSAVPMRHMDFL